ncbi:tetraacyldisaccharide 4'-kinase [Ahniella affigens]|uniref:Tetraacyldisaccharide 4'-kinase n=1 Tax=Ahniella affigens TaxID=2021234 RepID=A0A2P1PPD5_9GAMM|nr:tetraacyldisaccharide 4'-kinase [Ahniella affigens]AVP96701.1 tetraacyldisaccharide 4'-kinase [Ahniella affigens]
MSQRARFEAQLNAIWYGQQPVPWVLRWLAVIYAWILACRRWLYRTGIKRASRLPVPVLVIGNITVGGTGKTPLTAWLATELARRGWRPGIVSRGYGGSETSTMMLPLDADPAQFGDEPVWLMRAAKCPVAIGRRRADAGRLLIDRIHCDVILCDDGLQHWSLARDIEVLVVDGERRFGNELLLPAGPLREPPSRAERVDFVVVNGSAAAPAEIAMTVDAHRLVAINDLTLAKSIADFRGQPVHAVAGIGNPERFFRMLEQKGMQVIRHPFPDHHHFRRSDFEFGTSLPIVMTEKDAVKCACLGLPDAYMVPIDVDLPIQFADQLNRQLRQFQESAA